MLIIFNKTNITLLPTFGILEILVPMGLHRFSSMIGDFFLYFKHLKLYFKSNNLIEPISCKIIDGVKIFI